jgi:hypothetical protein
MSNVREESRTGGFFSLTLFLYKSSSNSKKKDSTGRRNSLCVPFLLFFILTLQLRGKEKRCKSRVEWSKGVSERRKPFAHPSVRSYCMSMAHQKYVEREKEIKRETPEKEDDSGENI